MQKPKLTIKLAYCGDLCNECPRYIATLKNDYDEFKKVAFLMKKVGWRYDLDVVENMRCNGCQDVENCEYSVKECCLEKNINSCGECTVYPCLKLNQAFKITRANTEKFKTILTKEEYNIFARAFFSKQANLDQRSKEFKK